MRRVIAMDIVEAPWRSLPQFLVSSPSSWMVASCSAVTPYMLCQTRHGRMYRLTLCFGVSRFRARSPVISAKQGQPADLMKGIYEVVWFLEAELEADEYLYVTGDPAALGSWEPDQAILMHPTETENIWKAKVNIAPGVNFRYNYFIKSGSGSSADFVWRPGPQFCLSVPCSISRDMEVIVRDSWTVMCNKAREPHLWGGWVDGSYHREQDETSFHIEDNDSTLVDNAMEVPRPLSNDHRSEDEESSSGDELAGVSSDNLNFGELYSERYQLIEEPWFPQASIVSQYAVDMNNDEEEEDEEERVEIDDIDIDSEDQQMIETLLAEDGFRRRKDTVSTMILINSSVCTMQRIAVLEDEKLVELLLEPVKTNVQCDSVYLGVITKFVPHMGGAFVNIGGSRHSFMDIRSNREPFIFAPFRDMSKKQESNGSLLHSVEEISASDPRQFCDGDDHENDEIHDVSDVLNGIVNGSAVDHGEAEADFDEYHEGDEQHVEVGSEDGSLPLQTKSSLTSNRSDKKDSKSVLSLDNKWTQVRKGTKIIVQVVKEGLGTKGPTLTAYPKLRSRFWVLMARCNRIGVSKKISGVERTRLKVIAKTLQPEGFGLTVRTVAAGHTLEELQKDLEGLITMWKSIIEDAKSAALAADEGVEGATPVLLHRAMAQTLSVVQDYFNDKVHKMVVDSPRTYHEVTNYLQVIAPDLCNRVELHDKAVPLFDLYNIEEEIDSILSKRVPLPNGGSLVIEQTEALVSVDVNGGHGMFGHGNSPEKAILEVNLTAARQIAREIRLRDIGGIIVVDFIDMADESNKRLVYEEVKKAVERDRSLVKVSELSRHGLMEITRKRVRPSVTFMVSEPCSCCHGTGRVEALETSFSKIEQEICRQLAKMNKKGDAENPKSWSRFILRVDNHMSNYLTTGKRTKLAFLSTSLKVWILLKVARHFTRGTFEVKPFVDEKANNEEGKKHQVAISLLKQAESRADVSGKKLTLIPIKKSKTSAKHRR